MKEFARQLDLFHWAESRPTAQIYDWSGPFAAKVMAHIHEYDDAWPKQLFDTPVTYLPERRRA
ncbi:MULTISPECIES: hypothetical protein [unclassified Mesorhizobium]|uniref:hypothetical protein n=1 Tax=unclassified Mesorhizobium TaxID=325217 RepID=UPI000FCAC4AE|nr:MULTISPECIES: hypothetical protein [unclassified Mesorhizobium]RUT88134.1 hypothetical protein EOD14_07985 [Mesorhizobium sp. M7A.T.Ca.US.000.02.1.1]RUU65012.1 hypothetical protein EOC99_10650 [Mesorhizobium sp. M7A.T.Ca.TU.009.01.1.1]